MFLAKNTRTGQLVMVDVQYAQYVVNSLMNMRDVRLEDIKDWEFWKLSEKPFSVRANISFDIIEED
jgi:hypothetical protein